MVKFGTKAETLLRIQNELKYAYVLPQIYFSVDEWKTNTDGCVEKYIKTWLDWEQEVIVRSSAINEDTQESSQAGKFASVANVQSEKQFADAVNKVIMSYDSEDGENQVLVQPMLRDTKICGVAFTLDPNSLGNYYVINYDESGGTSAVTSGNGCVNKLLYVFKGKESGLMPEYLERLCKTLKQLEELFGQNNLDVEFALTKDDKLYILQVRPLCISGKPVDYQKQYRELQRIQTKLDRNATEKPYLCGNRSIYGVMPDWNPAEMIGIRPKPLAMSLYQEIITDSVWAYQRDNYGYRNMRSFPLMINFGGIPYIDVRVSFNSFIPAGLDEKISNKLVNYYLDRLEQDPSKHDKIEFDIVFSCYTLDLPERICVLKEHGFSDQELECIISALRNVTNRIINSDTGLWRKDYEKINILESRYQKIIDSSMGEIEKIYWLLEDCKRYGTLPFAGLARGAFIAVQLLRSMEKRNIISKEDYQNFMNDVDTVNADMGYDFRTLTKNLFLDKYGHLRPGTYDINSLRYDEAPDLYFDWTEREPADKYLEKRKKFALSIEQMHRLEDALIESGLNSDILRMMDFIKTVIAGREYGKFIFTKSLSKAIQMIGYLGEKFGLTRDDCAYLDIQAIRRLYSTTKDAGEVIKKSVDEGRKDYELTKTLVLPPILIHSDEVWRFHYLDTEANYITQNKASGEIAELCDGIKNQDITNKIVLTVSADPGYDWIFSHHIKGFITMYGGANSHMAIRAGELGIPAAIEVGEKLYEKYKNVRVLEIDALSKTIKILK